MSIVLTACLLATIGLVGYFAWLFWTDPDRGLEETTHHRPYLPYVMADRYLAYGVLGLGMIFFGSPMIIAVYFLSGAIMGFADAYIYIRADLSGFKHLLAGALSVVAMVVALLVAITGGQG